MRRFSLSYDERPSVCPDAYRLGDLTDKGAFAFAFLRFAPLSSLI